MQQQTDAAMTTGMRPCPYCGAATADLTRCNACKGLLDPESLRVSREAMGAWFVRDDTQPHRPGCSYATLVRLVERGRVTRESVVRGPTTGQFWMLAVQVQGVAHLLGVCHACNASVAGQPTSCDACGVGFGVPGDRDALGVRHRPSHTPVPPSPTPARTQRPATRQPTPARASTPTPAPVTSASTTIVPDEDPVMQRLTGRRSKARRGRAWVVGGLVLIGVAGVIGGGLYLASLNGAGAGDEASIDVAPAPLATPEAPTVALDPPLESGVADAPAGTPTQAAPGVPSARTLADLHTAESLEEARASLERALQGASNAERPSLQGRLRFVERRLALLQLDPPAGG